MHTRDKFKNTPAKKIKDIRMYDFEKEKIFRLSIQSELKEKE